MICKTLPLAAVTLQAPIWRAKTSSRRISRQTNLTNADFRHAILHNTSFAGAILTEADFGGADLRGAYASELSNGATMNAILPDGHIHGLTLGANQFLEVRNYQNNFIIVFPVIDPVLNVSSPQYRGAFQAGPETIASGTSDDVILPPYWFNQPFPIVVDQRLQMDSGSELRLVFDSWSWQSTIQFQKGIPVTRSGTLNLEFAIDVDPATQIGRTFDVFDWTGVDPTGTFTISSPYIWDLSQLYTTGDITLAAVPEPSGLILAVVGLVGLVLYHGHRTCDFIIRV